jgi:hypothetical protein
MYHMDSTLKPVLKRQMIFIAASLGAGLTLTYFFGFLVGLTANVAIFMAAIFFIRWRQQKALRSLGFSSQTAGRGHEQDRVRLKYVCLSCGAEVKGDRCSCGSKMKKPLF